MVSVFPSLLSWSELSPLLTRLVLALVLILMAYKCLKSQNQPTQAKILALVEGLSGLFLVIGLLTQVFALVITIDLLVKLYFKIKNRAFLTDGVNYYILLLIMALGLILSGPGLFSIDYPL